MSNKWFTCPFCDGAIHEERNQVAYNRIECPTCNTKFPHPLREVETFVDGQRVTSYEDKEKDMVWPASNFHG